MRNNHRWNENDEIIGLYLYRFGDKSLSYSKEELADNIGMGWGSMSMKISNFRYLDGQGGLSEYSRQCENIYLRYKNMPNSEFAKIGIEAVVKAIGEYCERLQSLLSPTAKATQPTA